MADVINERPLMCSSSLRYVDFQEMGGVKMKDLKTHTNAVGGKWGDDTWAALVRDSCEEAFNTTEDGEDTFDDTQPKRAILIPLDVFPSSQIMKISKSLGQSDDYKKFGVDEETPSGVEEVRNSTQRSGTSLNLVLSDVSSIMPPSANEDEEDNIVFEELQRPSEEDFVVEDDECESEDDGNGSVVEEDEEHTEDDNDDETVLDGTESEDMVFTCMEEGVKRQEKARKSVAMKAKKSRNITTIEKNDRTFFVCPCGFSSTNKSGSTRHKCRNAHQSVLFPCKECGKICQNPGGLKRHIQTTHNKSRQSMSLPVGSASLPTDASNQVEVPRNGCDVCGKVLANRKNLESHMLKIHGKGQGSRDATVMDTLVTSAQETQGSY